MLFTGVDIPTLEAIIFIRPIKSRILFEQMIGRETKLSPNIGKDHFTIYDAVGVVDYFKNATNFPEPLPTKKTKSYQEIIDELANNKNRDYNVKILTRRLLRISKNISANERKELNLFIGQDIAKFAESFPENFTNDFEGTMKILQNESLIYKLKHYERIKVDFLVAENQVDEVSSEYFPIVVNGIEYKPKDYLTMFKEFLRKEPDTIEALSILLKRPKDLNTDLLDDLRTKLASRPEQFTMKNLRRAYGDNLADIVGIIKAAISEQEPIPTKARVGMAMEIIAEGKSFSEDEKKWLHWIANHLISNLLIEKKHFAMIPFSKHGGWKKADDVFSGNLEDIICQLNETMVS